MPPLQHPHLYVRQPVASKRQARSPLLNIVTFQGRLLHEGCSSTVPLVKGRLGLTAHATVRI